MVIPRQKKERDTTGLRHSDRHEERHLKQDIPATTTTQQAHCSRQPSQETDHEAGMSVWEYIFGIDHHNPQQETSRARKALAALQGQHADTTPYSSWRLNQDQGQKHQSPHHLALRRIISSWGPPGCCERHRGTPRVASSHFADLRRFWGVPGVNSQTTMIDAPEPCATIASLARHPHKHHHQLDTWIQNVTRTIPPWIAEYWNSGSQESQRCSSASKVRTGCDVDITSKAFNTQMGSSGQSRRKL